MYKHMHFYLIIFDLSLSKYLLKMRIQLLTISEVRYCLVYAFFLKPQLVKQSRLILDYLKIYYCLPLWKVTIF